MTTPMMRQYRAAKDAHPDSLVLFRLGDFFELFFEDAQTAHEVLGLTLTARNGAPMAGLPARSVDSYVARLIRAGRKVVICDQTQDADEAKGLVERGVTRVVTPGTVLDENGLDDRRHNFLLSIAAGEGRVGLASADLSTADFLVEECGTAELEDLIARIGPAEILLAEDAPEPPPLVLRERIPVSRLPGWRFDPDEAARRLCAHFGVAGLEGFGVSDLPLAVGAAGAVLHYLGETQRGRIGHLTSLRRVRREEEMYLDRATLAALEILRTQREGAREGSLLAVLDRTRTPMGARLLARSLAAPLRDPGAIIARQEAVADLLDERGRAALREALGPVRDLERLLARLSCGRGSARELVGLRAGLRSLPAIRAALSEAGAARLREAAGTLPILQDLCDLLDRALLDEVPSLVKEGGMIRPGFDPALDELRSAGQDGRAWIAAFQAREQQRTGIPSLRVGFNKVFGYYVEITHTHRDRVPPDYVRKQTVKNAERYVTSELKEYEEKVLGAEDRIREREYEHFLRLRDAVLAETRAIQAAGAIIAELDLLQSFADHAAERKAVRPRIDLSRDFVVEEGRHPVLDARPLGGPLVPNDLDLREGAREFLLITGPNMGGKSTYIRQAALLVVMAQAGAFVPARALRLGIVDRIFARIGASDEIARGHSTFMVEMIETAEILHHATDQSLVILDEVGRGTSTHDGLAIAWAIVEHLAGRTRARTLFATHYHQLLDLADRLPNAANLSVAVQEWGEQIVFLHRIVEGGTDRSYGLHVARLAGVPRPVVERARELLFELQQTRAPAPGATGESVQLSLFPEPDARLRQAILEVDPDRTTPLEALLLLRRLRELAQEGP
jgi:DNA mismatch repair protein MutS